MFDVEPVFWLYIGFLTFYFGVSLRRSAEEWEDLENWKHAWVWATLIIVQVASIGGFAYLFMITR